MDTTMTHDWHQLPPIEMPAPVLALAARSDALWAGGPGGVASYSGDSAWASRISGLPIRDVAALVYAGGWLIAGGAEGIARSPDGGRTWQAATIQGSATNISALAASPNFAHDTTILAATLSAGVIRSEDAGRTWKAATFGMHTFDVTALAWGDGENVLAGTTDGMYRSPNGGRAWRACSGSEGEPIAALAFGPHGVACAALETGHMLRSDDDGETWAPWGVLPETTEPTSLHIAPDGFVLLGTTTGVLRSRDGATWTQLFDLAVYCMASGSDGLYFGGATGAVYAWQSEAPVLRTLGAPPLHDLRHLLILDGAPLVWGARSTPVHLRGDQWHVLDATPLPLFTLVSGPDRTLWAASPDGLFRSETGGVSWALLATGAEDSIAYISFRADGAGWASSADGSLCLYTPDAGASWEQRPGPFSTLPLVALQALDEAVIVGAYDPRRKIAQLWRSEDEGRTWERGAEIATEWPLIATWPDPPLLAVSAALFMRAPSGEWQRTVVGDGSAIRRIVADRANMFVLTTSALWQSSDAGRTWQQRDDGLPIAEAIDLAFDGKMLFVLLSGGRVVYRSNQYE